MRKKLLLANICLLMLLSMHTFAQGDITGRITEEDGSPVVGATVSVKGTKSAVVANENGFFRLNAKIGNTLVASYVGYTTKEVVANGTTTNIILAKSSNQLNEVVVTALGIRKEKRALGYALSEVKGEELTQARSTNIANSLVGKVAGLNITQTATGPAGSSRISLRGNASLGGNGGSPLIVVDGIPFNNDNLGSVGTWGGQDQGDGISSLNPDEIESVSVLKGGTAAALYGSRASFGAILVTTKTGSKSGKAPVIEVGSNLVVEDLLNKRIKDYQYEYGTGDRGSTGLVGVKPVSADPNLNQTNSWGARLDGSPVIQFDGVTRPYVAQKDNFAKFYKTGLTFTNTAAVSGGNENISYRFSMSDLNNKGIVPNSTLVRDNVAMNINANLSKRLSVLVNGKYIREKAKMRPRVSDSPGSANYALWTLPTSLDVETLRGAKYNADRSERVWSNNQYVQNPYYATEDYIQGDTKDRFVGVVEPRFNITDWLYVRGRAGFDKYTRRQTDITPTGTGYQVGGGYNTGLNDFRESNLELLVGMDRKLGSNFNLSAVVGGNRMKQVGIVDTYSGQPFNIPFFYDISNVSTANRTTTNRYTESRINSVYGSADLSFKNYLYLNLTARNDWFSTLSPDRNSLLYPSAGVSFVLSDAFNLPSAINFAKLRGSWAQTGAATTPYKLALTYSLVGATQTAPLAQISQSEVPNPLLQPLVVTSSEIGLDARLFNNKLGIDLALYSRRTTDDIVSASLSPTSGYTSATFNVGEITNRGIELLLNYKVGSGKGLTWEPSFNLGYNKNNIVNIYSTLDRLFIEEPRPRVSAIYHVKDKPFAQILGNGFKRDQKSGEIVYNAQGLPLTEGLMAFGTGISPWTLGFTNSFRFKQFSLSFLVDSKLGGYIYSGTNALAYRQGLHKETLVGRETGIVGKGVNEAGAPNTVVVPAQTYYSNLYNFAEPFVYSSDFVKLRQVIIDYNVPTRVFAKTPFKSIVFSLVGRNLWTIIKHTPIIDPESSYSATAAQGQEFAGLPITRTMGFNLNLKF